ncbi:BTB/POZ domain-containing protein 3 [Pseudolycoriella hygida]|uniref:BTB/POZ domain-containing protein 3 n=1 Tax=Pseudolycoriella hygida TaxID=35572 RepID=A0A9Q0S2Z6_9DIPT|nr:BTB/POZ domain-containing protein 3 [Pseudolycoriella hygida]
MERKYVNMRGKMFFETNYLADYHFHFPVHGNCKISANKTILALASPILDMQFFGRSDDLDSAANSLKIYDIDPKPFRKFLLWIYSKELDFDNAAEAMTVFYAARKYEVSDLKSVCESYIFDNISTQNVFLIWNFSHNYELCELKQKCMKLVKRHTAQLIQSTSFFELNMKLLTELYKQNELWIASEVTLYRALEKYAEENNLVREHLDGILKLIRFKLISSDDIIKINSVLLTDAEKDIFELDSRAVLPDGFSTSKESRCTNYVHITEQDLGLLESFKKMHESHEEIDYVNPAGEKFHQTVCKLFFHGVQLYRELEIIQALKLHLPNFESESKHDYLSRILESDDLSIIVPLINALKFLKFGEHLSVNWLLI